MKPAGLLSVIVLLALLGSSHALFLPSNSSIYVNNSAPCYTPPQTNYATIQGAVDAAASGSSIIVCPGTYVENVAVDKTLGLYGYNSSVFVNASNSSLAVFTISANGVNMSDLVAQGSDSAGIYLSGSNSHLYNLTATINELGFYFVNSSGNTIIENQAYENNDSGFYLDLSNGSNFSLNTAYKNGHEDEVYAFNGFTLIDSHNNLFEDNLAYNNSDLGYYISSSTGNEFSDSNAYNNSIGGFYIKLSAGNEFDSCEANLNDEYGFYLNNSYANSITGCNASNNSFEGFQISYSDNNTILSSEASYNTMGFYLDSSRGNNLTDDSAFDNSYIDFVNLLNLPSLALNISELEIDTAYCDNMVTNMTGSRGKPIFYSNESANLSDAELSELFICNADYSTLNNLTIHGSDVESNNGVFLVSTDNSVLSNSQATDNLFGVLIIKSTNNTVGNVSIDNRGMEDSLLGLVVIFNSTDNKLTNVSVYYAMVGALNGLYSNNNNFSGLQISDTEFGILNVLASNNNTFEYATVNGSMIGFSDGAFLLYYLFQDGSVHDILEESCFDNTISNSQFYHNVYGVFMMGSQNSHILSNNLTTNLFSFGFIVSQTSDFANNIMRNSTCAIAMEASELNFSGNNYFLSPMAEEEPTLYSGFQGSRVLQGGLAAEIASALNGLESNFAPSSLYAREMIIEDSTLGTRGYNFTTDYLSFGLNATDVVIQVLNITEAGLSGTSIHSISGMHISSAKIVQSSQGTYYGLNVTSASEYASFLPTFYYNSSDLTGYDTAHLGVGAYASRRWSFRPSNVDENATSLTPIDPITPSTYYIPIAYTPGRGGSGGTSRRNPTLDYSFNCTSGLLEITATYSEDALSGIPVRLYLNSDYGALMDEQDTSDAGAASFTITRDGTYSADSLSSGSYNPASVGPFELALCNEVQEEPPASNQTNQTQGGAPPVPQENLSGNETAPPAPYEPPAQNITNVTQNETPYVPPVTPPVTPPVNPPVTPPAQPAQGYDWSWIWWLLAFLLLVLIVGAALYYFYRKKE